MADIGPDDLPFVPDASVSLIDMTPDPYTGKPKGTPTTGFHDWLGALFQKFKGVLVDLTTKITTLTADIGGLSAAITEEATIRETEDGILAAQITTVEAKADGATASGQVYIAAKAGPTGTSASYGWYLTAGSAFAGMEAMALSGGGSAIGFAANKFQFTDSGTAQPVFAYNGTAFVFQVPVVIQSGTVGERMVMTPQNLKSYDSGGQLRAAFGTNI